MAVSYKKLWKILINKDIKKKDLGTMAELYQTAPQNIYEDDELDGLNL